MSASRDPYINRLLSNLASYLPDAQAKQDAERGEAFGLVVDGYRSSDYNILKVGQRYYAVHRSAGAFDPRDVETLDAAQPIYRGESLADVTSQIDASLAPSDTLVSAHDPLILAAFGRHERAIEIALAAYIRRRQTLRPNERFALLGRAGGVASQLSEALAARSVRAVFHVSWSFGDPPPSDAGATSYVLCDSAAADSEWREIRGLQSTLRGTFITLPSCLLPLAQVFALHGAAHNDVPAFEVACDAYVGRRPHADPVIELNRLYPLRGKRVLQIGAADGACTGALVAYGAAQVIVAETRPKALLKLLAAKRAFSWDNVDIFAEDVRALGRDCLDRSDLVCACGGNLPLGLEYLTEIADHVAFIGWPASNRPREDHALHEFLAGRGFACSEIPSGDFLASKPALR